MSEDVLKGLTKRQLEELREKIERELAACVLCGEIGAIAFQIRGHGNRTDSKIEATMKFCKPCLEKHRLPQLQRRDRDRDLNLNDSE